jgi:Concanavalin A-like lectin/glucanases superfamily/Neutral/alkaline non-lysosomal ceramidase, N-terminal
MFDYYKSVTITVLSFMLLNLFSLNVAADDHSSKIFKAGVSAVDVTPIQLPVVVNGYFTERTVNRITDRLMSRAVVLDDGQTRIAIAIVDNLMIPRVLLDDVKQMVEEATGIPENRILISATHTHTAASVMACLGSGTDKNYTQFLPGQIAKSIIQANQKLTPAKIGWTVIQDSAHTNCRRWIFRPDHLQNDPFGNKNVRAHMHPGYNSQKHIGPSGPEDPDLSLLAIKTTDGKLLSVLGNYAFHYYGSATISADACGLFGSKFESLLKKEKVHSDYVGILSQGTSGDIMWMDYGQPAVKRDLNLYSEELAKVAFSGFQNIKFHDWVPLAMAEQKIKLGKRIPNADRLKWSKEKFRHLGNKLPKSKADIYAREQIYLYNEPEAELKLQAIKIGELGITAIPNEVYAITGLKLKAQSPFKTTFNVELANGAQGYIPPPEQHFLGGYTTWPARTAGLEVQAEPKIVETLLALLEKVAEKPRRKIATSETPYSKAVKSSKPVAYWRFEELADYQAIDQLQDHSGIFEQGVARYLPGPQAKGISSGLRGNRAAHFAGGRMKTDIKDLNDTYSVEFWFWNGLPHNARPVTGYLFSRGKEGDTTAAGDHLGIGGTYQNGTQGKLIFFNGNKANDLLIGINQLKLKTWNHVVLVRNGKQVSVYLNGNETPEISGEIKSTYPSKSSAIFIGGRCDHFANFEGKIDEVAIYNRVLSSKETSGHFKKSEVVKPGIVNTSAQKKRLSLKQNHFHQ